MIDLRSTPEVEEYPDATLPGVEHLDVPIANTTNTKRFVEDADIRSADVYKRQELHLMTTQTISAVHERQQGRSIEERTRAVRDAAYRIRLNVLDEGEAQGEGYVGQALGVADVLAVLYADQLRYQATDTEWAVSYTHLHPLPAG